MTKCACCGELIPRTSMSYKISSGFIEKDGNFIEDAKILVHPECSYLIEPFHLLEKTLKES